VLTGLGREGWRETFAGLAYPAVTVLVVIGTANHYLLDAIAGALLWWAADAVIGVLATTSTGRAAGAPGPAARPDMTGPRSPLGHTPPTVRTLPMTSRLASTITTGPSSRPLAYLPSPIA
jgi:hypothetical protein